MNFRNNKLFKIFTLGIFLIFNIHGISNSDTLNKISKKEHPVSYPEKITSLPKFDESVTKQISIKLDSIMKRFNKRQDFHGNILVAKGGKILFENEVGYANFSKKIKLDKDDVFQLASVSKQFTAVAVLMLYEKGKLDLDDTVIKFYPDFPYKEVTIRQLLNHTSGLPKYFWLAEHEWSNKLPPENKDMMEMVNKYKLLHFFKAGSRFDYSNTGYFVLAALVEKISGKSYKDFVETSIFKPLQMDNSFVYRYGFDNMADHQLWGYRIYKGWRHLKIGGTVNDAITGDKNIYSTTEDLFRWITGLNSGKLISKETLKQMYTKGKTKYNKEVPYGFGFRIDDKGEETMIYHNGKWNGFSTSIRQYPESDLLVITLEHSSFHSMKTLHSSIKNTVDTYFKE
jgi:CubicO group peptidase (beta-lactamase class C family)